TGERVHLFLRVRLECPEIARCFRLDLLEPLQEALLQLRKAPVVVLHLVAEQQIADFVDAHGFRSNGTAVAAHRYYGTFGPAWRRTAFICLHGNLLLAASPGRPRL